MGYVFSCQKRFSRAAKAYKNALVLDPDNENYKKSLAMAEEKHREAKDNPTDVCFSTF